MRWGCPDRPWDLTPTILLPFLIYCGQYILIVHKSKYLHDRDLNTESSESESELGGFLNFGIEQIAVNSKPMLTSPNRERKRDFAAQNEL